MVVIKPGIILNWNNVEVSSFGCPCEFQQKKVIDRLPAKVRNEILYDILEPNMQSAAQKYFTELLAVNNSMGQELFQKIILENAYYTGKSVYWNMLVVLSQLEYSLINPWGTFIALSATRHKQLDIQEIGIACFEKWESREAIQFLLQHRFEESWLQEYADMVCSAVMEDETEHVLCTENKSRQMAWGGIPEWNYDGEASSGCSDYRFENDTK